MDVLKVVRKRPSMVYTGLALLIMLPLLTPGYVLALDMAWGPHLPRPEGSANTWLLISCLNLIMGVVPGWLVQKAVLFAIFAGAGIGAHRLCATQPKLRDDTWSLYAGGLLYVLNPFVYTRFVNGQWLILAGYALTPWVVRACWQGLQKPRFRRGIMGGAWLGALGLVSIHIFGITLVALTGLLLTSKAGWRKRFVWVSGLAVSTLLLSSVWLVPTALGTADANLQLEVFSSSQLQAFATDTTLLNTPVSTLVLEGFWADNSGRYLVSSAQPGWMAVASAVVMCVAFGAYVAYRRKDRLALALGVTALMSWILALGISTPITAPLTNFMHDHFTWYAGFREPQKWLALLALSHAYLFAHALSALRKQAPHFRARMSISCVGILLPFIFGGYLLVGARGQLRAVTYPTGWRPAQRLAEKHPRARIVVLPWRMYMPIDGAGRTVANPAPTYFTNPVMISNDARLQGLAAQARSPLHTYVATSWLVLREAQAAQRLRANDVRFVVVLKQGEWKMYDWLQTQPGFRVILHNADVIMYELTEIDT